MHFCLGSQTTVLELEPHAQLNAPWGLDRPDVDKNRGRCYLVNTAGVLVVEHVERSGAKAQAGRFVILVRCEGEIVAPAQVEVHIRRHGFCIARHAAAASVEPEPLFCRVLSPYFDERIACFHPLEGIVAISDK